MSLKETAPLRSCESTRNSYNFGRIYQITYYVGRHRLDCGSVFIAVSSSVCSVVEQYISESYGRNFVKFRGIGDLLTRE